MGKGWGGRMKGWENQVGKRMGRDKEGLGKGWGGRMNGWEN